MQKYRVCGDQLCDAATGPARLPAAQAVLVCGFGTVTGHPVHPPARHRTVIPRCGESLIGSDTPDVSAIFQPTPRVSVKTRDALRHAVG